MLQSGDINKSFMEVFNSMKEGVKYRLTAEAFMEINNLRREWGYDEIKPFSFFKSGKDLYLNWEENNWTSTVFRPEGTGTFGITFTSFGFTIAIALAFAFAFAENRIQEVIEDSCDGNILEIDGKKY